MQRFLELTKGEDYWLKAEWDGETVDGKLSEVDSETIRALRKAADLMNKKRKGVTLAATKMDFAVGHPLDVTQRVTPSIHFHTR